MAAKRDTFWIRFAAVWSGILIGSVLALPWIGSVLALPWIIGWTIRYTEWVRSYFYG